MHCTNAAIAQLPCNDSFNGEQTLSLFLIASHSYIHILGSLQKVKDHNCNTGNGAMNFEFYDVMEER